jgi:uncharacterized protein (DUF4415 family)
MNKKQKPSVWTDPDDAPVWTAEDFEQAEYRIGETEFSREEVQKAVAKRTRGRPKSDQSKVAVKLRLDPDLLAVLRATGDGWQTRINRILRDHFAI